MQLSANVTTCISAAPMRRWQRHLRLSMTLYVGHVRRRSSGTKWERLLQGCMWKVGEPRRNERGRRLLPRTIKTPPANRAALASACRLAKTLSRLSSLRQPTTNMQATSPSAKQGTRGRNHQTATPSPRAIGRPSLRAPEHSRSRHPVTPPKIRFRVMLDWDGGHPITSRNMDEHHLGEKAAERIQVRSEIARVPPSSWQGCSISWERCRRRGLGDFGPDEHMSRSRLRKTLCAHGI